nr:MAG TPA: protein of unknown function (DUF5325) [Caudoviricetes sp.]
MSSICLVRSHCEKRNHQDHLVDHRRRSCSRGAMGDVDLSRNHRQDHHHGRRNRVSPVSTSGGFQRMKKVDWLFVLFWFLIACAYGAIIVGALMNGWVLFLVLLGVLSAVALVGAGGK